MITHIETLILETRKKKTYCYNYKNKEKILYNQEYLDYLCIIRNNYIYSCIISLFLEDVKFLLLIVFILLNINTASVLSKNPRFQLNAFLLTYSLTHRKH